MKIFKNILVFSLFIFALNNAFAQVEKSKTSLQKEFRYTNPITRDSAISMRDHFIIKVDDLWYCVGTSNPVWTGPNPGVRMLVSKDLINWKQHSFIIDAKK
ncbi:MAG: hypothetical protein E2600_07990, partial [Chryseobacterium sp.]|nr:hypothetical protein [Chryseobacterium sp.]